MKPEVWRFPQIDLGTRLSAAPSVWGIAIKKLERTLGTTIKQAQKQIHTMLSAARKMLQSAFGELKQNPQSLIHLGVEKHHG